MPDAHIVRLNNLEKKIATHVGELRFEYNKRNKVPTKATLEQLQLSYGAELAVAKTLNVWPDFSLDPTLHPEWDVRYGQYTLDVKHTTRRNGRLLYGERQKGPHADVYVLVTGEMNLFLIVGWTWGRELLMPECMDDTLDRPTYAIAQQLLNPLLTLTQQSNSIDRRLTE